MTVINGEALLRAAPIKNMIGTKEKQHGVSYGLGEAGYDIRLKQEIRFLPYRHSSGHVVRVLENGEHYSDLGRFIIASAIEEFDMPLDLMGIVHDKSTWARQGVSVFNTVIEPGWKGFLTLEIVFHGNKPVMLPAGAGIAQVVFHRTAEARAYSGKYQHQADEPIPSRFR